MAGPSLSQDDHKELRYWRQRYRNGYISEFPDGLPKPEDELSISSEYPLPRDLNNDEWVRFAYYWDAYQHGTSYDNDPDPGVARRAMEAANGALAEREWQDLNDMWQTLGHKLLARTLNISDDIWQ